MADCIIRDNGFKVIQSDDLSVAILANGLINSIIDIPEKHKNYRLISNNVDFYWGTRPSTLIISYKGFQLIKFEKANSQLVLEYLTKFDSLSKKEVEELLKESQEKIKTSLELEIAALKKVKEKLVDQDSILKQIGRMSDEIKQLLTKLED